MSTSGTAARAIALAAVSALGLAACATSSSGSSSSSSTSGAAATTKNTTITAAYEQEFGAYNNNTADQNAVKNTVVLNKVLDGFWYLRYRRHRAAGQGVRDVREDRGQPADGQVHDQRQGRVVRRHADRVLRPRPGLGREQRPVPDRQEELGRHAGTDLLDRGQHRLRGRERPAVQQGRQDRDADLQAPRSPTGTRSSAPARSCRRTSSRSSRASATSSRPSRTRTWRS